jgi:hypothetical protein
MVSFFHNWSPLKRLGALVLVAVLLSFLSFAILFLEYGVLNFGDSDLPPYQPDTLFEKAFDAVWFTVTCGAGLLWLCVIIYVIALLFRIIKRRVV